MLIIFILLLVILVFLIIKTGNGTDSVLRRYRKILNEVETDLVGKLGNLQYGCLFLQERGIKAYVYPRKGVLPAKVVSLKGVFLHEGELYLYVGDMGDTIDSEDFLSDVRCFRNHTKAIWLQYKVYALNSERCDKYHTLLSILINF